MKKQTNHGLGNYLKLCCVIGKVHTYPVRALRGAPKASPSGAISQTIRLLSFRVKMQVDERIRLATTQAMDVGCEDENKRRANRWTLKVDEWMGIGTIGCINTIDTYHENQK